MTHELVILALLDLVSALMMLEMVLAQGEAVVLVVQPMAMTGLLTRV